MTGGNPPAIHAAYEIGPATTSLRDTGHESESSEKFEVRSKRAQPEEMSGPSN